MLSTFLPTSGFKWIVPKNFDLKKYNNCSSSNGCVLELDPEYSRELRKLHNDYPLAPDKKEIKKEMLSSYKLKIADFYNMPLSTAKKLVPNVFDKEKYALH